LKAVASYRTPKGLYLFRKLFVCLLVLFAAASSLNSAYAQAGKPADILIPTSIRLPDFSAPVWGRWLPPADNKSGVPLGGLGTGFLELRPDGQIYDTVLHNNWTAPKTPANLSLNFSTETGRSPVFVPLVSTYASQKPPARYFGHYPMVEMDFGRPTPQPLTVWLRAYSPFVMGNVNLSNIPAAIFSLRVRNEGTTPIPASFHFDWEEDINPASPLARRPIRFKNISGMVMESAGSGSYAIGVDGAGWSVDVQANGLVRSGMQIAVRATIPPGEERIVTFALGWHFPTWRSPDGKLILNRYGTQFADAGAVAQFALEHHTELEKRIILWQQAIYSRDLPGWLKDGLINSLATLARDSILPDDGRLMRVESSNGRPVTETMSSRFYGSLPTLLLFPEQEKATLRAFGKLQAESGQIPSSLAGVIGTGANLDLQKPIVSTEFVLLVWRDYLATGDAAFLKDIFPRAKRALQYAMTLDTDGDGLINEAPGSETGYPSNQFYDSWPWFGTSAYTAGLGLAALRAGEELAKASADTDFAAWCHEKLEKGKQAYDQDLWTRNYYRLYTDPEHFKQSDTTLANQLVGQEIAWLCDLGTIFPEKNISSALEWISEHNVKLTEWGAVSGVKQDGMPDDSGAAQSKEVVLPEAWNFATTALMAAKKLEGFGGKAAGLAAAENAYRALIKSGTLWNPQLIYSAKDATPISGSHYYGNLCFWALPLAMEGVSVKGRAWPTGK
jgi:non-lysosomal glucosylceramidase